MGREVGVAADETVDRREVDDRAASGRPQQGNGVLRAEEDALEVGREDRVPGDLGAFVDRPVAEPPSADARPVEEDVDALEAGEERLDLVRDREVCLLAIEPDDVGAGVGEGRRDRASDPAGGPGDDGHLSCQAPLPARTDPLTTVRFAEG